METQTKDLVSVIIPCYNGEQYIDRCMHSLINQTYKKLEIIIINDGSTDKSEKKIKEWVERLEKQTYIVKYYFQENQGSSAAINSGLKLVTGEYLTLLDVDDVYMPLSIEKRVKFLKVNTNIGLVRTNGWYMKDNLNSQPLGLFVNEKEEKNKTDIFEDLLSGRTNNWAGSYMIRTELLFQWYPDRNIYCSRYGQNLQLLLPIAYKNQSGFLDEPLMMYIRHDKSSTIMKAEKKEDEIQYLCKNQAGYLEIKQKMIDMLIKDPKLNYKYTKMAKVAYHRQLMIVALCFKDKNFMKKEFAALKKISIPTIDDHITYCRILAPYFVNMLKVLKKIKNIIKIMLEI